MCVSLQRDLFALGARLADPAHKIAKRVEKIVINDDSVARLEGWIDRLDTEIPPLRHFILSDGCPARRRAAPGAHGVPPRRALGAVCSAQDAVEPVVDRLPESPVRSAVHDGAGGEPSRRSPRNALVDATRR